MVASHDSSFSLSDHRPSTLLMGRWACRLAGGLLLFLGLCATVAGVEFLSLLGFGIPALIAGVSILVASEAVSEGDRLAALVATGVWLLHGGWVMIRVLEASGNPSPGLWATRLVLALVMLAPILPRKV